MSTGTSKSPHYLRMSDRETTRKVVLVREGGTLELHGERKTSWTRLAQTIPAMSDLPCPFIYDHSNHEVLCLFSVILRGEIRKSKHRHTHTRMHSRAYTHTQTHRHTHTHSFPEKGSKVNLTTPRPVKSSLQNSVWKFK